MKKRILAYILIMSVMLTGMYWYPLENAKAYAFSTGIDVNFHTTDEIVKYCAEHPTGLMGLDTEGNTIDEYRVSYGTEPDRAAPYSAGLLSYYELTNALNTIKTVRYIAGISDNIELSMDYTANAQAACMVNYANGTISHYPKTPSGMDTTLARKGVTASLNCNLSKYTRANASLKFAILDGWMYDSDISNLSSLGHRRWILNPDMGSCGFGIVGDEDVTYDAMYVRDTSNEDDGYTGVCWPAANMPTSYFPAGTAWSISIGEEVDINKIKVILIKNDKTGGNDIESWFFTKGESDGEFYVNNQYYGQTGCIIFRPKGIESYEPGDSYYVSISGLSKDVSYTVNFFDLENYYNPEKAQINAVETTSFNKTFIAWDETELATSYNVYRKARGGSYRMIASGIHDTSFVDSGAGRGITYYYKVSAVRNVDGVNYEGEQSGYFKKIVVPLAQPTFKTCKAYSKKNNYLVWSKVSKATGYRIYRKLKTGDTWVYIKGTTGTSYHDVTAKSGKTYEYKIVPYRVFNGYLNTGTASVIKSVQTK